MSREDESVPFKKNTSYKELNHLIKRTGEIARKESFAKGNPIVYIRGRKMVREYPDGKVVEEKIDQK